jgi:hypothetical protein
MAKPMKVQTKKLLVAAVGVASVSYLACGDSTTTGAPNDASADAPSEAFISSGNLMGPSSGSSSGSPEASADVFISSGNLMGPLPEASSDGPADAPRETQGDAQQDRFIGSGNLVAPPPDAGAD